MREGPSAKRTGAIFAAAHPLALRLYERLGESAGTVLVVGDGSGRNSSALREAGLRVVAVPDSVPYTQLDRSREFAGAVATHAYLHGTSAKVRAGLAELASVLVHDAPAFLTLGSIKDVRYGFGDQLDAHTFAPGTGPEFGVPHAYFDLDAATDLLRPLDIVSLEEVDVDEIVGKWAHAGDEPAGKVHWFAEVRSRG